MNFSCYFKDFSVSYVILLLCVNDMLIGSANMKEIIILKRQLAQEFKMKDKRRASQIFGMRISQNQARVALTLFKERYINKVLNRF